MPKFQATVRVNVSGDMELTEEVEAENRTKATAKVVHIAEQEAFSGDLASSFDYEFDVDPLACDEVSEPEPEPIDRLMARIKAPILPGFEGFFGVKVSS
jgi:hypothetical protein